jgi:hypothetical protein
MVAVLRVGIRSESEYLLALGYVHTYGISEDTFEPRRVCQNLNQRLAGEQS